MRISCFGRWFVLGFVTLIFALPALPQYTDPVVIQDVGGPQEFARRRAELSKQLKTGYLILFARVVLPEANPTGRTTTFSITRGCPIPAQ